MKQLKYFRIIVYFIIFLGLLWLKFTDYTFGECYINANFGIICPTCGITRAVEDILNLDFISAVHHNAYYVFILFPIFSILFIDDIICMLFKKKSFVEMILRYLGGHMDKIIIAISYLFTLYFFYLLIKARRSNKKSLPNTVYVIIVIILVLIIVWNIFR